MPVTKKNIKWVVVINERKVLIQSKTYVGACYKAFKKLGIDPTKRTKTLVKDWTKPDTIQYENKFEDVYCIAID